MDMRVNDRNLTGATAEFGRTQESQKTECSASSGAQSTSRSAQGDQVELSGALGRLSQALNSQGTERAARVAALTAAYRSGSYQPNAMGASKGLVSEALSTGGGH